MKNPKISKESLDKLFAEGLSLDEVIETINKEKEIIENSEKLGIEPEDKPKIFYDADL